MRKNDDWCDGGLGDEDVAGDFFIFGFVGLFLVLGSRGGRIEEVRSGCSLFLNGLMNQWVGEKTS